MTASRIFDDAEDLLAATNQCETAMQEVIFVQNLLFVFDTGVVQIHAAGLDRLARFGNRLEQSGLHAGFRHTVAHRGLGELTIDLHTVKSNFKRSLVNTCKIAATAEQRTSRLNG